uniref:Cytochrome b561 domain-containing protein n=1 Tax=Acrobeloides nanus TaxID=290746 RepID=A0A914DAC6_9BILA
MVINKHDNGSPELYSFHSWLGVLVFGAYVIQFILGFINYAYPKTHLEIRRRFMPTHRIAGNSIFIMSVATVLTGHQRFACFAFNESSANLKPNEAHYAFCYETHTCVKRLDLILNCSTVFLLIYGVLVCVIIRVDEWKREQTPDEKQHTE